MERLDFASVMMVLRRNIPEERCPNQTDLVYSLLGDVNNDPRYVVDFDQGQVCRWLNGLARLSPNIVEYFGKNENQKKLLHRIQNNILPIMPDSAMAVQELYDLLMQAPNVSQQKKQELTEDFSFEDDNDAAVFVTEVLCLAMQLRFVKRDIRRKALNALGNQSPAVIDYIFDTEIPRPCPWFLGRSQELEQLHGLLVEHSKVFVQGIAGIGKSELAKAYARLHGKEYTNVLYMNYSGDMKQSVIDLDFADDLPDEAEDVRFKRHNRFLRSLKEDTLLIVDNFNRTATEDPFLDVMLKYRCRILFTTRCRYENYAALEVTELKLADLLALTEKFFSGMGKHQEVVEAIISVLHRHTFAVELAARLLGNGIIRPNALLKKLEAQKAALDTEEKIGTVKDGHNRKATYYGHIHSLFALYRLSQPKQDILRSLTLLPQDGIPIWRFASWMGLRNGNVLQDLIEMGLIQPKNDREILMHPMIREVAVVDLKPSIQTCKVLLSSIRAICVRHGEDIPYFRSLAQTIGSIMMLAEKDDTSVYLRFLEDVFPCMMKYRCTDIQEEILTEMNLLIPQSGSVNDQALLLDYQAAMQPKPEKAIPLELKALELFQEIGKENAHLVANLHCNVGGLYKLTKQLERAQFHMEMGIRILETFQLLHMHDSIPQINNYAVLLCDMGQPEKGITLLQKLARVVRERSSDQNSDYAVIQEAMGAICLTQGKMSNATGHYQKAMAIYERLYAEEPQRIEEKKQQLMGLYTRAGLLLGKKLQEIL